jgi:hypothetical protein
LLSLVAIIFALSPGRGIFCNTAGVEQICAPWQGVVVCMSHFTF